MPQRYDLRCQDVAREIDIIQGSVEDHWLVCYGADMVEILAFGLRRTLGTNNTQAVAPEVVRRCLATLITANELYGLSA